MAGQLCHKGMLDPDFCETSKCLRYLLLIKDFLELPRASHQGSLCVSEACELPVCRNEESLLMGPDPIQAFLKTGSFSSSQWPPAQQECFPITY